MDHPKNFQIRVYGTHKPPFHRTWQSRSSSPEEDSRGKLPKTSHQETVEAPSSQALSNQPEVHPTANMGQEYSSYVRENKSADGDERFEPVKAQDHTEPGLVAPTKSQDHIIDLETDEEIGQMRDAQITPKASLLNLRNPSNAPTEGLATGFFSLDWKDRKTILEMVLRRPASFRPYYNANNLELPDVDEEVVDAFGRLTLVNKMDVPNINVPLFTVNKQMSSEASAIFYGVNSFKLDDPTVGKWWLKRIGTNVGKIRNLHLVLRGYEHLTFQTREEKLWVNFLAYFHKLQNLSQIIVDFSHWHRQDFSEKWDHNNICRWRKLCVDYLAKFSGLKFITIIKGEFITSHDARKLGNFMKRERGFATVPFDFQISENAIQIDTEHTNPYSSDQIDRFEDAQRSGTT